LTWINISGVKAKEIKAKLLCSYFRIFSGVLKEINVGLIVACMGQSNLRLLHDEDESRKRLYTSKHLVKSFKPRDMSSSFCKYRNRVKDVVYLTSSGERVWQTLNENSEMPGK